MELIIIDNIIKPTITTILAITLILSVIFKAIDIIDN